MGYIMITLFIVALIIGSLIHSLIWNDYYDDDFN